MADKPDMPKSSHLKREIEVRQAAEARQKLDATLREYLHDIRSAVANELARIETDLFRVQMLQDQHGRTQEKFETQLDTLLTKINEMHVVVMRREGMQEQARSSGDTSKWIIGLFVSIMVSIASVTLAIVNITTRPG